MLTAARLGRRFIGMDDSPEAQQVIEKRLQDRRIKYQSTLTSTTSTFSESVAV